MSDGVFISPGDTVNFEVGSSTVAVYRHEGDPRYVTWDEMYDKMDFQDDAALFVRQWASTPASRAQVRGRDLDHSCMVIAMRKLLGNERWCPLWVETHIRANRGFSLEYLDELERWAPVRSMLPDPRVFIPDDEEVIALFILGGRGHAECLRWRQAKQLKSLMGLIRRKEAVHGLQRPAETPRANGRAHARPLQRPASAGVR